MVGQIYIIIVIHTKLNFHCWLRSETRSTRW